jgi:hypothetical protein
MVGIIMKKWILLVGVIAVFFVSVIVFHQKMVSFIVLPQYIAWATETEASGIRLGQPLDEKQLVIANEIGIKKPENVRIIYVDEVPFPYENLMLKVVGEALGFIGEGIINNAQVFGYSIYVRKGYELTTPNLAHELVHVLQIERTSIEQVITQHFSDLVTYGYDDSPLEVEAFKAEEKYQNR